MLKVYIFFVSNDKLIWNTEKNGNYSVRSAYRICVTKIADNTHLHVSVDGNLSWKLKVPPKVKNFVWRVRRGCFPTRARLSSGGVAYPIDCVTCDSNYEDSIHVLVECPKVVQVWRNVNMWDTIIKVLRQYYNIHALIFTLFQQFSPSQSELFKLTM